jgi:hypothetical protein
MRSQELYTFFFEFLGGTYVSQVRAKEPSEAMYAWATNLDYLPIDGMGNAMKKELLEVILDEPYSSLDKTKPLCTESA